MVKKLYERSCNFQRGVLSANIGRFVNLRNATFLIIELSLLISSFILALDISQPVLLNPLNKINKHSTFREHMKSEKSYTIETQVFLIKFQTFEALKSDDR